jgi:hypothetical protein
MSSTAIDPMYEDLPVLIVKDWSKVTRAWLEEQYMRILKNRVAGKYNYAKLQPEYWNNLILSKSRHAQTVLAGEERPGRCWKPAVVP